MQITRRQTLAGLGAASTLALLPACAANPAPATASGGVSTSLKGLAPDAALDRVAYAMLAHEPGARPGSGSMSANMPRGDRPSASAGQRAARPIRRP